MSQAIRVSVSLRFALEVLHRFLMGEFGLHEVADDWKKLGVVYDGIELGQKGFHDHDYKVETRPITFTINHTPFFRVWFYHSDSEGWVAYEYEYRFVCRFTDPNRIMENEWLRMVDIPNPKEGDPKHDLYQLSTWRKATLDEPIRTYNHR